VQPDYRGLLRGVLANSGHKKRTAGTPKARHRPGDSGRDLRWLAPASATAPVQCVVDGSKDLVNGNLVVAVRIAGRTASKVDRSMLGRNRVR